MADKILKVFETLRGHYQPSSYVFPPTPQLNADGATDSPSGKLKKDTSLTPRERIHLCNAIADYLPLQNVKNGSDFPKLLTIAIELLLVSCNDDDADVRFVAGECINRIIKAFLDSDIGRIQVELYKEIKKNGESRSLRVALQKFGDTCSLIRTHKCRPYISNMLPCIVKIAKRVDDAVQEVLGAMMLRLCPVLGKFMNENDIKILMRAFLPNLKSPSASIRRIAASTLNALCYNSRKPAHFYSWLINALLSFITPVARDTASHTVLGTLLGFRHIIPHLADSCVEKDTMKDSFGDRGKKTETGAIKDFVLERKQFHQIYEVTMFLTKHYDHNVVTAALENLIQVLSSKMEVVSDILLSPGGLAPTITVSTREENFDSETDVLLVDCIDLPDEDSEKMDSVSLTDNELLRDGEGHFSLSSAIPAMKVEGEEAINDLDVSGVEEITYGEDTAHQNDIDNLTFSENDTGCILSLDGPANIGDAFHEESGLRESPISPIGTCISEAPDTNSIKSWEENGDDASTTETTDTELPFNIDPVTCSDVPILHCVRLLCSFLLSGEPGSTLSDKKVRVSIKSLALNCIGLAVQYYPEAMYPKVIPIDFAQISEREGSKQLIRDIVLLKCHDDPQIRGNVSIIIGHFLCSAMQVSGGNFDKWDIFTSQKYSVERIDLKDCIQLLHKFVNDDSALVIKQTCIAVRSCMNMLCHSTYDLCGYELAVKLLRLSSSTYWLVKVELLQFYQGLDYHLLSLLEMALKQERRISNINCRFMCLQDQFLNNVLMDMLGDEDPRVRHSAGLCCVNILENLSCDPLKSNDMASHKALHSSTMRFLVPERVWRGQSYENRINVARNLSYLVRKITEQLHVATSKYMMHGCMQGLFLLSEKYPVVNFPLSWEVMLSTQSKLPKSPNLPQSYNTFVSSTSYVPDCKHSCSYGLQYILLDFITSTWMTLDLQAHVETLKLCVHLLCGASNYFLQKKKEESLVSDCNTELSGGWASVDDPNLVIYANKLFLHVMKLLSIITCVLEQTSQVPLTQKVPNSTPVKDKGNVIGRDPTAQVPPNSAQNLGLPNPESPRKFSFTKALQKNKDLEEGKGNMGNVATPDVKPSIAGSAPSTSSAEKPERLGTFQQDYHLAKLYEVLKGSFKNYQVSSAHRFEDKFCSFMRGVLESFGLLMELATFNEVGGHAEEVLEYLKVTACVEEATSLLAVQQLLKGLFGTNAAAQPDIYQLPCNTSYLVETLADPTFHQENLPIKTYSDIYSNYIGLYGQGFLKSYNDFCLSLKLVPQVDISVEKSALNFLRVIKKNLGTNRPSAKVSKERISSIQNYIRLFEPLVIRALKSYTTSSSIQLQCQAIHLLDQLIRLRVNYSLLDSEQVFIGFVLKQFDFVENGQISQPELFIITIFQFLVLLSYECFQHKQSQAKAIVGMPRIIQLCNDIMACGLPTIMYAVPALKPIVHDLFAPQSQTRPDSQKDLDTQREVVVSMLLRLTQYPQILNLLTHVLEGSKNEEAKWKRLSRQVVDVVLPNLSKLDVNLMDMNSLLLLFNLMDALAPLALRPADIILKPLFGSILPVSTVEVISYTSAVIALTRTLIMQNSEDIIFSRIQLLETHYIRACFSVRNEDKFLLCESKSELNAAYFFASYLLCALHMAVENFARHIYIITSDKSQLYMLSEMLRLYFDLLVYILKCGSFKKLSKSLVTVLFSDIGDNEGTSFVQMITVKLSEVQSSDSLLFLKWMYMIRSTEISVEQFHREFHGIWSMPKWLSTQRKYCSLWKMDLIRHGSLIVYCDITVRILKEQKVLDNTVIAELLRNNILDLLNLLNELPVKDSLTRIIQLPSLTPVFIDSLSQLVARDFSVIKPTMLKSILALLESTDLSFSDGVVNLLLIVLPKLAVYGLSRKAETLACRRLEIEYIRSMETGDKYLDKGELVAFQQRKIHMKRYPRFCALIQRITREALAEIEPSVSHPLDTVVVDISKYTLKQEWMTEFVQTLCFSDDRDISHKCSVYLLRSLGLDRMQKIMLDEKFNKDLLQACIEEAYSSDHYLHTQHRHDGRFDTSLKPFSVYDTVGSTEEENKDQLLSLSKKIVLSHVKQTSLRFKGEESYCSKTYFSHKKDELTSLVQEESQLDRYFTFLRCLVKLLQQSVTLNQMWDITEEESMSILEYILILPAVCVHEMINIKSNIVVLELCFCSLSMVFHCDEFKSSACLSNEYYAYVLTQTIHSVSHLVHELIDKSCCEENDSYSLFNYHEVDDSSQIISPHESSLSELNIFQKACAQTSALVRTLKEWIITPNSCIHGVPDILVEPLRRVIAGLGRLHIVNCFARIPPVVWKFGWQPLPEGPYLTDLPPLPVDILKEKEVLQEFIFRVNHIGWTSRTQFEETWAALLGVLSSIPIVDVDLTNHEEIELAQSSSLVVHCITSLLLDTILSPIPGNSAVSQYSIIYRQKDYPFLGSKPGKKLIAVRNEIELCFFELSSCERTLSHKMFNCPVVPSLLSPKQRKHYLRYGCMMKRSLYISNLELPIKLLYFHMGQVSAASMRIRLISSDTQEDTDSEDEESLIIAVNQRSSTSSFGSSDVFRKLQELDIRSCLQFLLELFEQWLSPTVTTHTPLMLKMEAIKSLCVLSDLFLELNHYEWVLGILLDFSISHANEDEITSEYLIPTICKALAVLKIEGVTAERICKQIEVYLKVPHVPLQVSCMVGSLYILETSVSSTVQILVPILVDYVMKRLDSAQETTNIVSIRYKMVFWSLTFYLMENSTSENQDSQFPVRVLEAVLSELKRSSGENDPSLLQVLFQGLERLIVSFSLTRQECDEVAKMAANWVYHGSTRMVLSALGLLCTCIYTGKDADQASGLVNADELNTSPMTESRLVVMEIINILLSRIRKGQLSEAALLATVLPRIMLDFLPSHEVMNKLITEFLSSQQPRPEVIAKIFNKVSDLMYKENEASLVCEWVFLSINSFVQRTPLSMAVWSLTCFFISTSINPWLKSLFSYVVERKGKLEVHDKHIFCVAALDFYLNQNLSSVQREQFLQTFRAKSETLPSSPYENLIDCCVNATVL